MGEHLGFSLEVHFGVDIGRVYGDVSKPRPDGVDINTGA